MFDLIFDVIIDSLKLIPFLFFTFLLMEYIEHKISSSKIIKKVSNYGPILGGILGIVPQCGFSVAMTNLYATRIITLGTLISIYLSTSDEMLPLLIAGNISLSIIIKIVLIKLLIGIISGLIIDLIIKPKVSNKTHEFCCDEHCHCEDGIFKSAIKHTLSITLYIFIFTFVLNSLLFYFGEDNIKNIVASNSVLAPFLSSLIGLIPNCAASVMITELYLTGITSIGTTIAGLLTGSGVGLLVLFKVNHNLKENFKIIGILYVIGVVSGLIVDLIF